MPDINCGKLYLRQIVEVATGDVFDACTFWQCELVGVGGYFTNCLFEGGVVNGVYKASFIHCAFFAGAVEGIL